jgi:cation diffusion facilitator CzcD-associated flavoprotein CzcO
MTLNQLLTHHHFSLNVTSYLQKGKFSEGSVQTVRCNAVVIATGLATPNIPSTLSGIEHTMGYEDLPPTGEPFEGKTVAVIGMGNGVS